MQVTETSIPGLVLLTPGAHQDHRGFFVETWREEWLPLVESGGPFVQDNHAMSTDKGVVRGLHFQAPPHAQSKLIWVSRGAIYDVAVDIREGSPTYGKWEGQLLSAENFLRLFVPRGFAHGYMTLEPCTEVNYKVDGYHSAKAEGGLLWNDPALGIAWPDIPPILSDKDKTLPLLQTLESPFTYRKKQ